jgi:hypothetical protein
MELSLLMRDLRVSGCRSGFWLFALLGFFVAVVARELTRAGKESEVFVKRLYV